MKRSTHLMKSGVSGPSGLAQETRLVEVGTFGSASIPSGESRSYSFQVAEGGSIEPGPDFNPNHDSINGRTASGKIFGPGGADSFRVTGQIVSSNLPAELSFRGKQASTGGQNGSGGGGNGSGGGGGNGSGGGGGNGGGGGGSDFTSGNGTTTGAQNGAQQAGVSTTTMLVGGGILAAAGVAAFAMGGSSGQSN